METSDRQILTQFDMCLIWSMEVSMWKILTKFPIRYVPHLTDGGIWAAGLNPIRYMSHRSYGLMVSWSHLTSLYGHQATDEGIWPADLNPIRYVPHLTDAVIWPAVLNPIRYVPQLTVGGLWPADLNPIQYVPHLTDGGVWPTDLHPTGIQIHATVGWEIGVVDSHHTSTTCFNSVAINVY
jgi:hypothetical protein